MNDQALRFRIGVFMLLSLILLAILVLMFGGLPSYFKKSTTYTVVFNNAPGISKGTPVKRLGVRIGEVRSIQLDNDTGKVNVGIEIDEGYNLRTNDRATLQHTLLGGDATIAFLPPDDPKLADAGTIAPRAIMPGYVQADANALLQKTTDLMPQAQEALVEIRKAFQRLEKAGPDLERLFSDLSEMARIMRGAVPELKKTNEEIRDLVKIVRQTVPDFKRTGDEIQAAARSFGKVSERVDVFLQNNEDKLAKSLDRVQDALKKVSDVLNEENQKNMAVILKNLRESSAKLDGLADGTKTFLKEGTGAMKSFNEVLGKTDEMIERFSKTAKPFGERGPTILKNVDEMTVNLNRTLLELREVMQAAVRSDGTVQKLLTDPALYNNLNDSAQMVTRILPRLDRVLRDVEVFADKIARHPESLGLGGMIRPSSGLKENPSVLPQHYRMPAGSVIGP